jgi:CTD small phosphatase-like protein 2
MTQDDDEDGYYMVRPGAMKLLATLRQHFEIVVFTAAVQEYADWVLDQIDVNNHISHRLYRQHTTKSDGNFV